MCCEGEAISARDFKAPKILSNRKPDTDELKPSFKLNQEIDFKKPSQDVAIPKRKRLMLFNMYDISQQTNRNVNMFEENLKKKLAFEENHALISVDTHITSKDRMGKREGC